MQETTRCSAQSLSRFSFHRLYTKWSGQEWSQYLLVLEMIPTLRRLQHLIILLGTRQSHSHELEKPPAGSSPGSTVFSKKQGKNIRKRTVVSWCDTEHFKMSGLKSGMPRNQSLAFLPREATMSGFCTPQRPNPPVPVHKRGERLQIAISIMAMGRAAPGESSLARLASLSLRNAVGKTCCSRSSAEQSYFRLAGTPTQFGQEECVSVC